LRLALRGPMRNILKLMCVLAHPDDESLGTGGTLAKYSAEGVETYLVTATRGERGRFGGLKEQPGPEEVGRVREAELRAAARELGLSEVVFLDYLDKDLDKADPTEAVSKIVGHVRRVRPQVVITFGPEGAYGHPDHIAISQLATAAVVAAADASYQVGSAGAHRVSKLYFMAWPEGKWKAYQAAFRNIAVQVDGKERLPSPWPEWAITSVIDTAAHWPAVWRAICRHQTQLAMYKELERLPEDLHRYLWGSQEYYRVFSAVNGGRERETDLFAGLR
jgi:LmbE family N-acetylglucosaminyl deacetylase